MVSDERRHSSELQKTNEELNQKLEKTLTHLSGNAARSVAARRGSIFEYHDASQQQQKIPSMVTATSMMGARRYSIASTSNTTYNHAIPRAPFSALGPSFSEGSARRPSICATTLLRPFGGAART